MDAPSRKTGRCFCALALCVPPRTFVPHVKGQLARDVVKTSPGQFSELKNMEMTVRSARPNNGTASHFMGPTPHAEPLRFQTQPGT